MTPMQVDNRMRLLLISSALNILLVICFVASATIPSHSNTLRPPSVPLIVADPYFSIWSPGSRLADSDTTHWTGISQSLASLIRIDGRSYRLMGTRPTDIPALPQIGLEVTPTRSIYSFEGEGIRLILTFMTPMIPSDLDVFSRPVTYLTWAVNSTDSKKHSVSLYYDNTAEPVVNTPDEIIVWSREKVDNLSLEKLGTQAQPILAKSGDDLRINWGYLYVAVIDGEGVFETVTEASRAQREFAQTGAVANSYDTRMPRAVDDHMPAVAITFRILAVGAVPIERHILLAYDEIYSVELLHRRLRPYWRRNGDRPEDLLRKAAAEYSSLEKRCKSFDELVQKDLTKVGGAKYASLGALAYRAALAANGLAADVDGRPLFFTKENFSDGSISTPDVIYPESPLLLLFSPELMRASLEPVFQYASSGRWYFPFAPAQLGTYPLANGQTYGGGETSEKDQQPVEESANMLIMTAALVKVGGASSITDKYWTVLSGWADYIRKNGLDPVKQLCTDDFAGPIAHNANLSLKAIEALAAYSYLSKVKGDDKTSADYLETAQNYASNWIKMADDTEHTRLAFDQPGTWSQKYNLVWDRILEFNLFPREVARKEVGLYKQKSTPFGFPLDSQHSYTKLDWETWSASLADSPSDFDGLMVPVYNFVDRTPNLIPLTDWYDTADGKAMNWKDGSGTDREMGFHARPVVGAVFIRVLSDPLMWKEWSSQGAMSQPNAH